jgi:uncharacterized membrane protein
MILLAVLVGVLLVAMLVPRRGRRSVRDAARVAMAVAMVFSGVSHFAATTAFVQLLPEFVPARTTIILVTGVVEILLGIGLLPRRRRREVALLLVAYLVAVFPANVYVAVADVRLDGLGGGNPWLRLPFQAIYIAWVFWAVPGTLEPARALIRRLRGAGEQPARPGKGVVQPR